MSMTPDERAALAPLIAERRGRVFGTKRAAYNAAMVNSATWDKAEAGESVRGDLLRRIVKVLWPATEGDWTAVVGADGHDPAGGYVSAPGPRIDEGALSDDEVLQRLDEMERDIAAMRERLAQRKQSRP